MAKGIEVRIPKEITDYHEKILGGMSIRQLVCFGTALVLGVGSFLLLTFVVGLSMEITSYIVMLETMPLMALGFIRPSGMTFEKYVAIFLQYKLGTQIRLYETELSISQLPENTSEGGGKYDWIFEKDAEPEKSKQRRGRCREPEARRFTLTRKERKERLKAVRQQIEAARQ